MCVLVKKTTQSVYFQSGSEAKGINPIIALLFFWPGTEQVSSLSYYDFQEMGFNSNVSGVRLSMATNSKLKNKT